VKPSRKALLTYLKANQEQTLLDFGCKSASLFSDVGDQCDYYACDIERNPGVSKNLGSQEFRFRQSEDPMRIPYDDDHFDVVFSNSVFEHVVPIEEILAECARVLKPTGRLICVFPTSEVFMEPHVKIPLVTRFAPGENRVQWLEWMHRLGFGTLRVKREGSAKAAALDAERYLENEVFHRPLKTYHRMLEARFSDVMDRTADMIVETKFRPLAVAAPLISKYYGVCFHARAPK
jgi:ubiquinone/menaquinone biosynthesis C-methylase UbiE